MKYLSGLISAFFILISPACDEDTNDPNAGLYKVSGYVYYQNSPISNVTASLDNKSNYTVQTNDEGYFSIADVDNGNHQLKIYKSFPENGEGFSERTYDLSVNADVVLNSLRLPKAVQLHEPTIIGLDSIQIAWSPSDIEDFREYKIYRHPTSGLDETTGTLIHISTSINDTTFLDTDITEPGDFYYRVYVMNDYGRLGGSNIVSYTLNFTYFRITINYTGSHPVSNLYPLSVGIYDSPYGPDMGDEGSLHENNTTLEIVIDDPNSFHYYLHYRMIDDYTFGPYYVASFLYTGNSQISNWWNMPSDCPAIIYEGINPFDSTIYINATPIAVSRADTTEITVTYDDSFISP